MSSSAGEYERGLAKEGGLSFSVKGRDVTSVCFVWVILWFAKSRGTKFEYEVQIGLLRSSMDKYHGS